MIEKLKNIVVEIVRDNVTDKVYNTFTIYSMPVSLIRFEIKMVIFKNIFKE